MTPLEIREARTFLGLTQKAFGEMLHAKLRTVQAWEAGDRNMTLATKEMLTKKVARKRKK
jgi:DNA-binding transcriptional regulator YiaG